MGRIKYTKEILEDVVKKSISVTDVLKYFGLKRAGGTHNHISKKIKDFNIDTSHFRRFHLEGGFNKKTYREILILRTYGQRTATHLLVRSLKEAGIEYKCSNIKCDILDTWNDKKIVLQVDHINRNWLDNRIENLKFLCPNCHSQTRTFGGKKFTDSKCINCKTIIYRTSKRCRKCANRKRKSKIEWPSTEYILKELENISYVELAKKLKVSDNAIRKRLKRDW